MTYIEKKEVRAQIAFYKAHRRTFQYGRFSRLPAVKTNKVHWQCMAEGGGEAVAGFFQTQAIAAEGYDFLPLAGFDPAARYTVQTRPQAIPIRRFGGLVKHILPVTLHPDGLIVRTANRFLPPARLRGTLRVPRRYAECGRQAR